MLKLVNTKLLAGIFAALVVIGGLLVRQHQVNERQAAAAEKTAVLLKAQRDEAQAQKDHDAALWRHVQEIRNAHPTANVTTHKATTP